MVSPMHLVRDSSLYLTASATHEEEWPAGNDTKSSTWQYRAVQGSTGQYRAAQSQLKHLVRDSSLYLTASATHEEEWPAGNDTKSSTWQYMAVQGSTKSVEALGA
jgi:hypothetical protein